MYGSSNYSGGHHHQNPPRIYQNPNRVGDGYSSGPYNADQQLLQWFNAADTDGSGTISVAELEVALANGNWTELHLDTVKMLMNIFDTDRNGNISFQEFSGLWGYITEWKGVFQYFDKNNSGSIHGYQLSEAIRNSGYELPPSLLTLLERKYASGPSTGYYDTPTGITFDRFVRACVSVKTLSEGFKRADADRDGWITISYVDFMKIVLSSPWD